MTHENKLVNNLNGETNNSEEFGKNYIKIFVHLSTM